MNAQENTQRGGGWWTAPVVPLYHFLSPAPISAVYQPGECADTDSPFENYSDLLSSFPDLSLEYGVPEGKDPLCGICLESLVPVQSSVRHQGCGNVSHIKCGFDWAIILMLGNGYINCPWCRAKMEIPDKAPDFVRSYLRSLDEIGSNVHAVQHTNIELAYAQDLSMFLDVEASELGDGVPGFELIIGAIADLRQQVKEVLKEFHKSRYALICRTYGVANSGAWQQLLSNQNTPYTAAQLTRMYREIDSLSFDAHYVTVETGKLLAEKFTTPLKELASYIAAMYTPNDLLGGTPPQQQVVQQTVSAYREVARNVLDHLRDDLRKQYLNMEVALHAAETGYRV